MQVTTVWNGTDMKKILLIVLAMLIPFNGYAMETGEDTGNTPVVASTADDDFLLDDEFAEILITDPLETVNRGIFWFNDKLYVLLLRPVGNAFQIVPLPLRIAWKNFFSNLRTPIRLVNAGLQGKFAAAGNEMTRFLTNTTLGIGGLFDPSEAHFGIRKTDEDTGQTLGYYGAGPGMYLVLPLLGPSSIRDGLGQFADAHMNLGFYLFEDERDLYVAAAIDIFNDQSLDKNTYENIRKDALDPYLFVRDAYFQYRRNKIEN